MKLRSAIVKDHGLPISLHAPSYPEDYDASTSWCLVVYASIHQGVRKSVLPVLTIASSKGGPGKTTVTMLLAGRLAADGVKIAALDADPTKAFSRWAANTYEGPALKVQAETDEARLAHLIDAESQTADLVLVDTAGFGNRAAAVAMTSADAVLVPCLSGEADLHEAEATVKLVGGLARAARREIPVRVLLNRVRRTQLARHAAREAAELPLLAATLSDLVAYGEISFSGQVPTQGTAGDELDKLLKELRCLGWLPLNQGVKTP